MTGGTAIFEPSDRELIERFQRGDARAFGVLYARYSRMLIAFIVGRTSRGFDAENLAQEIWVKIHADLGGFQNDNFRAWMFTIARNRLIDDGRRKKVRREHGAAELAFPEDFDPARRAVSEDPRLQHLGDCLKHLDGKFVETIVRNKVQGESPEQIAQSDGVKTATIYTRISRGMELLGDCVGKKLQ